MSTVHYHIAQVNIARMRAPLDSPEMAEFASQLPVVNAAADGSPGFVWRLTTPEGDATAVRAYEDVLILFNLSVWESVEALKQFTYSGGHVSALRDRGRWFEAPTQAHLALWWIPAGHVPSVEEAVERLAFRREHGDTAAAFGLLKPAARPDEPTATPVPPPVNLDRRLLVVGDTRFYYRQSGARVWATYWGGAVRFGAIVGVGDPQGRLDLRYHHLGPGNALESGVSCATPELLPDGRIRLIEDRPGRHTVLEEVLQEVIG